MFLPSKRLYSSEKEGLKKKLQVVNAKYGKCYYREKNGAVGCSGRAYIIGDGVPADFPWFLIADNMICFYRLCCPLNPAKKLLGEPFVLRRAVPVDLFPHTPHCELVLLFTR